MEIETIEDALKEMRKSESALLIDCQLRRANPVNETISGDPRKYTTFANAYPEALEVEGNIVTVYYSVGNN